MEIAKRLNAIIAQLLPFLSQEVNINFVLSSTKSQKIFYWKFQHQQQVVTAVERAKQVSMSELNAIIGVRKPLAMNTQWTEEHIFYSISLYEYQWESEGQKAIAPRTTFFLDMFAQVIVFENPPQKVTF